MGIVRKKEKAMANRKNSVKQRKQQNSSRPANRSSSNRYPGESRRADSRRYYEDREYADYRRSNIQQTGRYGENSRYYEDRYPERSYGYDSRYSRYENRGYPEYESRRYSAGRAEPRYKSDSGRRRPEPQREDARRRQNSSRKNPSRRPSGRNAGGRRNRRNKRPVRIKKRFYIFALLLILIIAVGGYFGVKALVNNVVPSLMDKFHHTTEAGQIEEDTDVKETESGDKISDYDSVSMERMILDDLGTPDTQIKVINSGDTEEGEEAKEGEEGEGQQTETTATDENTIDLAKLPNEEKIRAAVLSSWYISPLGQDRATIEESFGVLNKYEDWAGGVYYHKGFPDSMYIMYKGKNGRDGMPGEDAVCTGVSVALEQIIEFDPFIPNEKWGSMHKDNGDFGWTDYYYSLLIQKGINLIVYCEADDTVNQQTHIIVRQVK